MKTVFIRLFAFLAGINCIWVAIDFTMYAVRTPHQELFLFPGLYLIEITILGILGIAAVWQRGQKQTLLLWNLFGVYLPLIVLGMWSFGLFLIPPAVFTLINALLLSKGSEITLKQIAARVFFFTLGQLAIMYIVVLFYIS